MAYKHSKLLLLVAVLVVASQVETPNFEALGDTLMPPMVPKKWEPTPPLTKDFLTTNNKNRMK